MKHIILVLLIATVNIDALIGHDLAELIMPLCDDSKHPASCFVFATDCVFDHPIGDVKVIATCVNEASKI